MTRDAGVGMEDEEIAVDESVPKETKLSVENVIDQLGGFGWYQQVYTHCMLTAMPRMEATPTLWRQC